MSQLRLLRLLTGLLLLARPGIRPQEPAPVRCPAEGIGGDPGLNRQKNREGATTQAAPITFAEIAKLPHQAFAGKLSRSRWPRDWRREVESQEARAVVIEGYVMGARVMGPETANCGDRTSTDVHFALGEANDAPRSRWLVTEMTPRVRSAHPMWHMKVLKRLSRDHARVRITGWLLYDHEHFDRIGINRISAWEIHPVTKIEVWSGGVWREL